jgi:hypothetical protein
MKTQARLIREVEGGAARRGLVRWALVVAVGALACSTTEFKSTWRDPTAKPVALRAQPVAAFVITPNVATRRAGEDILARELSARGVRGIPGYQLTGDKPVRDSEALRRYLEKAGIEGTVIMRVVDRRVELDYVPGGWGYGSMYGYWEFGWGMMGRPGYLETDTVVSVETLVYSLPQDKLLWGGVSETTDPNNLDSFIKEVVSKAGEEFRKAGLVQG